MPRFVVAAVLSGEPAAELCPIDPTEIAGGGIVRSADSDLSAVGITGRSFQVLLLPEQVHGLGNFAITNGKGRGDIDGPWWGSDGVVAGWNDDESQADGGVTAAPGVLFWVGIGMFRRNH